jgi:hypothetical protein
MAIHHSQISSQKLIIVSYIGVLVGHPDTKHLHLKDLFLVYTNMKLTELKAIAKENKVLGRSIMNKPEFIASLKEKGLLPVENTRTTSKTKSHPVNDARYDYLKYIRRHPKRVIIEDLNTGEVVEYPSLYKAGRAIGVNSKRLLENANKIMNERFKIIIPDTHVN